MQQVILVHNEQIRVHVACVSSLVVSTRCEGSNSDYGKLSVGYFSSVIIATIYAQTKNISPINRNKGYAYPLSLSNVDVCSFLWWSHTQLLYTILKAAHSGKSWTTITELRATVGVFCSELTDRSLGQIPEITITCLHHMDIKRLLIAATADSDTVIPL